MVIETKSQYLQFKDHLNSLNCNQSVLIRVVPNNNSDHYVKLSSLVVLVWDISNNLFFVLSTGHQDINQVLQINDILSDFEKLKCKVMIVDKKSSPGTVNRENFLDLNLVLYLSGHSCLDLSEFNEHKIKVNSRMFYSNINNTIPCMSHLDVFQKACLSLNKDFLQSFSIKQDIPNFNLYNHILLNCLYDIEKNGLFVDEEEFRKHFQAKVYNGFVYTQYNFFTSTGRPSNRFDGVNYSALNKDNGCRKSFVSRFGKEGKLIMMDYSAFHPRIICYLTNFKLDSKIDIYKYLAHLYFHKDDISDEDISKSKAITFRQLYGGVEDKYQYIKYFVNLKEFVRSKWDEFQLNGYVSTPIFGRKIHKSYIPDPSDTKVFNYILQASELEVALPSMVKINNILDKMQSKLILYTYDALLFDVHKDELRNVITILQDTISVNGSLPIKTYIGDNYDKLVKL